MDAGLKRETGLGWAGVLHPPRSGSDRLTEALKGTPVTMTVREDQIVTRRSHRGRRRRLWDALKQVRRTGRRSAR